MGSPAFSWPSANDIVAKGRGIASHVMEAAKDDLEFAAGRFTVKEPTDRSVHSRSRLPRAMPRTCPRRCAGRFLLPRYSMSAAFPTARMSAVEVDCGTGTVEMVGYAAVDDVGRAVNPMILHGQPPGGLPRASRSPEEDDPFTPVMENYYPTLPDYAMPNLVPFFRPDHRALRTNPMGIRAGREGRTTPPWPSSQCHR